MSDTPMGSQPPQIGDNNTNQCFSKSLHGYSKLPAHKERGSPSCEKPDGLMLGSLTPPVDLAQ